jgi:hypothetical protein
MFVVATNVVVEILDDVICVIVDIVCVVQLQFIQLQLHLLFALYIQSLHVQLHIIVSGR